MPTACSRNVKHTDRLRLFAQTERDPVYPEGLCRILQRHAGDDANGSPHANDDAPHDEVIGRHWIPLLRGGRPPVVATAGGYHAVCQEADRADIVLPPHRSLHVVR